MAQEKAVKPQIVNRIAIGSCANQNRNQEEMWQSVLATKPELFLFLGDNVYADTDDAKVMRAKYQQLGEKLGYQKLKKQCPIFAVWDDHDYGFNDSGKEYVMKVESEKIFHEFFETPKGSEVLSRPGIYQSQYFGEKGQRLQVILLDTRYFRDELIKLPERTRNGPYARHTDTSKTILGEAQWQWLEAQLQVEADFRVIASSIQFLPQDHRWELWENFPHERVRLLQLLKKYGDKPVLFVSGDRHMGEIMELKTSDASSPGFPIFELTSSGLTNAGGGQKNEVNRHRVGKTNFQSRNFGLISIDWSKQQTTLELRDIKGKVVDSYQFSIAP